MLPLSVSPLSVWESDAQNKRVSTGLCGQEMCPAQACPWGPAPTPRLAPSLLVVSLGAPYLSMMTVGWGAPLLPAHATGLFLNPFAPQGTDFMSPTCSGVGMSGLKTT